MQSCLHGTTRKIKRRSRPVSISSHRDLTTQRNNMAHTRHLDSRINRIFKDAYWSDFKSDDDAHSPEILANREYFRKQFGLVSAARRGRLNQYIYVAEGPPHWCDHIELYKTSENNRLLLISPYSIDEEVKLLICSQGFQLIPPVYASTATSFVYLYPKGCEKDVAQLIQRTNAALVALLKARLLGLKRE